MRKMNMVSPSFLAFLFHYSLDEGKRKKKKRKDHLKIRKQFQLGCVLLEGKCHSVQSMELDKLTAKVRRDGEIVRNY